MGSRCDPSRVIPAVAYAEAYRSQRHNTEVRLRHRWRFEPFVSLTIYTGPLSRKGEVLEVEQSDPEPLFHLSGSGGSNPVPSSRQSVSRGISSSCIEKPAVAAACAGPARRHGRQRRAGLVNITPTAGNISVGPYSSTAVPARRFATVVATGAPSE